MIKIIVADREPFLLAALELFFKDKKELNLIGYAENETKLQQELKIKQPDLLLFDPEVLTEKGLPTISKIKIKYPTLKLLVFTIHSELSNIKRLLKSGIHGCMYKNTSKEEVLKAIETLLEGNNYYDHYISSTTMYNHYEKLDTPVSLLTARETEITRLIASNMSTAEIALKLSISKLTVESHRKNIFTKLGINKVTALVHYAIKEELI